MALAMIIVMTLPRMPPALENIENGKKKNAIVNRTEQGWVKQIESDRVCVTNTTGPSCFAL